MIIPHRSAWDAASYHDRVPRRPAPGRAARRRQRRRRNAWLAGAALALAAIGVGSTLVVLGSRNRTPPAVAAPVSTTAAAPTTVPSRSAPTTMPATTTTTAPDPGSLPQTADKPSSSSAVFTAGVNALWDAIRSDDPERGMSFFFPLGAYLQVKAISNPESDWHTRLVANYAQDIHALHARLGTTAAGAELTGVDVPDGQATWVLPGAEYNKGSYWRVYNAVLRYTAGGQSGSFPIASMISWRGEWYVVHLNSIR
jgi:hypothetical protein